MSVWNGRLLRVLTACVLPLSLSLSCGIVGIVVLIAAHPHLFLCVSCVGLLVQQLNDTILSSYAYKSHYLLTESNRAELKLPMIPSSSSAPKKTVGKGN